MEQEAFLTISDVSERLQLSHQAVRNLILTGELPAFQIGGRKLWRIPESCFNQYVTEQLSATKMLIESGQIEF